MYSQATLLSFQLALAVSISRTKPAETSLKDWITIVRQALNRPANDSEAVKVIGRDFLQASSSVECLAAEGEATPWKVPQLLLSMQQLQRQLEPGHIDVQQLIQAIVATTTTAKTCISRFVDCRIRNEHRLALRWLNSIRKDLGGLLNAMTMVAALLMAGLTSLKKSAALLSDDDASTCISGFCSLLEGLLDSLHEVCTMLARRLYSKRMRGNEGTTEHNRIRHQTQTASCGKGNKANGNQSLDQEFKALVEPWIKIFLKPLSAIIIPLSKGASGTENQESTLYKRLLSALLGVLLRRSGRLIGTIAFQSSIISKPSSSTTSIPRNAEKVPAPESRRVSTRSKRSKPIANTHHDGSQAEKDEHIQKHAVEIQGHVLLPLLKILRNDANFHYKDTLPVEGEQDDYRAATQILQRTLLDGVFHYDDLAEELPGARLTDYLAESSQTYTSLVLEAKALLSELDLGIDTASTTCMSSFVDSMWELYGWDILETDWDRIADVPTNLDNEQGTRQEDIETEDEEL